MLFPAFDVGTSDVPAKFLGEASQGLTRVAGDQPRRYHQHQVQWQARALQLPTVAVLAEVFAEPFQCQPDEVFDVDVGIAEVSIYRLAQGQDVTHF